MDSNYILDDLAFMIGENIRHFFHKNNYGDRFIEVTDMISDVIAKNFEDTNINDHAFNIMVHLKNRRKLYLEDETKF